MNDVMSHQAWDIEILQAFSRKRLKKEQNVKQCSSLIVIEEQPIIHQRKLQRNEIHFN